MVIGLSQLEKYQSVEKLIYHSVDLSLYQVSAVVAGEEHYVSDCRGKLLRSVNLIEMQKTMRGVHAIHTVLRHTSTYDEMVGGATNSSGNTLEVPLKDNELY